MEGPGDGPVEDPVARAVVLKSNVKRTVSVEHSPGLVSPGLGATPAATFVKRFHAPGLSRLRDRRRARGEAKALSTARERGLPVPAVLGVGLEEGRWTLRLEWIDGATQLGELMQHVPCRLRRVDLARRLGDLLARVERVGLRHRDPHAGNVLVDPVGQVWLVDLARARIAGPDPGRFRRMLVRACAGLRQTSTPGFRALVYRSYLRRRLETTEPPTAAEIESEARSQQRLDVTRRVDVWRRTSSATLADTTGGGQRIIRARAAGSGPDPGWTTRRIDGDRQRVAQIWSTLVRATLHALPTARPRTLALAPPWFVELDVPEPGHVTGGVTASPQHAAAFRMLLHDRGLMLEGEQLIDAEGRPYVGPAARLLTIEGPGDDG